MINKTVIVDHSFIIIGRKKVEWGKIVGLKEYNSVFLNKITGGFPRAEIFLLNGQGLSFSAMDNIIIKGQENINRIAYENAINKIKINCKINNKFKSWIEWRLFLPVVIFQVLILLIGIILDWNYEKIILLGIFLGIAVLPFSWYWELYARKKIASDNSA